MEESFWLAHGLMTVQGRTCLLSSLRYSVMWNARTMATGQRRVTHQRGGPQRDKRRRLPRQPLNCGAHRSRSCRGHSSGSFILIMCETGEVYRYDTVNYSTGSCHFVKHFLSYHGCIRYSTTVTALYGAAILAVLHALLNFQCRGGKHFRGNNHFQ